MKFFLKISFAVVFAVAITVIMLNRYVDGFVDMHYNQFLKSSNSLVVGSSRAHIGIDPSVFKEHKEMLNFALTGDVSPYGPLYTAAIKEKLVPQSGVKGLFILEVNPFTLSRQKQNVDDDPDKFAENKNCLGKQFFMNMDPNYEYIFRNNTPLYNIPFERISGKDYSVLHSNGWLQLFVDMQESKLKERKKSKIHVYEKEAQEMCPSALRLQSFKELIAYLNKYGDVYLVRIPVDNEMFELENRYWSDFESQIIQIADSTKVHYFNLQNDYPNPVTIDATHLEAKEAIALSSFLKHKIDSVSK